MTRRNEKIEREHVLVDHCRDSLYQPFELLHSDDPLLDRKYDTLQPEETQLLFDSIFLQKDTLFDKEPKSGAITKTKSGPRATIHGRGTPVVEVFFDF